MNFVDEKMRSTIAEYIEDSTEDMLSDLEGLIRIESVSSHPEKVKEALDYTLGIAGQYSFRTGAHANNRVGTVEMGEGDECLGILSHVDVVPADPLEQWETPPFTPVLKDGNIFGRGAMDDKGMVIASIYAMKAVRELGLPLKKKVRLIIGTQEETRWDDMEEYIKTNPLPDYGFTPDGEFPIYNIEKGVCDVIMEFEKKKFLIDAPDEEKPYVVSLNGGSVVNAVPAKAEALLSDGRTITVYGKAAHSSMPNRGINALFEMRRELKNQGAGENIFTEILDMLFERFGDCEGKALSIYRKNEYYNGEYVHRNIFSPDVFTTDDDKISVLIDVRFAYGTDENEIIGCLSELAAGLGGTVRTSDVMPAVFVSRNKPFLKAMADTYETVTGFKNSFETAYGASYAKAMPNTVSWGPIFPGERDTCHEPNEFIPIENLKKCAEIFANFIAEIALQEESFR